MCKLEGDNRAIAVVVVVVVVVIERRRGGEESWAAEDPCQMREREGYRKSGWI